MKDVHHALQGGYPRTYSFLVRLTLPLAILQAMAFLFGWFLALAEMDGEIARNDATCRGAVQAYYDYEKEQKEMHEHIFTALDLCAPPGSDSDNVFTEQCAANYTQEHFPIVDLVTFFGQVDLTDGMTFDWIRCYFYDIDSDPNAEEYAPSIRDSDFSLQLYRFVEEFVIQVYEIEAELREKSTLDDDQAAVDEYYFLNQALPLASGGGTCHEHVAGGALYWFTIMTTIGYGNASVITNAGRLLVFTCGGLTIILFLALNATAAHMLRVVVDDALIRCRLRRLTRGAPAVLFWLILLVLWIMVLATVARHWYASRAGGFRNDFALADAMWYSYITITTVGFGDIHIPHHEFTERDMVSIPTIILIGFMILANFADKLFALVKDIVGESDDLADILRETQPKEEDEMYTKPSPQKWIPPPKSDAIVTGNSNLRRRRSI